MIASRLLAVLSVVLGCTHPAAPAPVSTPDSASHGLPPPDEALRRWQVIHDNADQPPAGTTAAGLLPELEAYLGSPDPVRRDAIAFDVLAAWIVADRRLGPDQLRPLAIRLTGNLAGPLDRPDGVYLRSFSALVLSLIARRDRSEPFLDDAARRAILIAARDYANRETDLRGHTGERGWAHAAAHTADLLGELAKHPALTAEDRGIILDAVAGFVVRRHGMILNHGEDDRLAQPVLEAARAGLATERVTGWLATLAAPIELGGSRVFDPRLFAAQRNARNLLVTLFVQLTLDRAPNDGTRALLDRITRFLAA
jgi:hypothetical protein